MIKPIYTIHIIYSEQLIINAKAIIEKMNEQRKSPPSEKKVFDENGNVQNICILTPQMVIIKPPPNVREKGGDGALPPITLRLTVKSGFIRTYAL